MCKLTDNGEKFYYRIQPLLINLKKFNTKYDLINPTVNIFSNYLFTVYNSYVKLRLKHSITFKNYPVEMCLRKVLLMDNSFCVLCIPNFLQDYFIGVFNKEKLKFRLIYKSHLGCRIGLGSSHYNSSSISKEDLANKMLLSFKYYEDADLNYSLSKALGFKDANLVYIQNYHEGIEILNNYDSFILSSNHINQFIKADEIKQVKIEGCNIMVNYYLVTNHKFKNNIITKFEDYLLKELSNKT